MAVARGLFVQCSECGKREFRKWDRTLPPGGLSSCSSQGCIALSESESDVARPRVFCASLADWLDNEVPIEWLVDLLDLIRRTPNLDWLLLTKRIGNWPRLSGAEFKAWQQERPDLCRWMQGWLNGNAPSNVWLGATVVNHQEAVRDVPKLLDLPARIRFLSVEPMLGPIDLTAIKQQVAPGFFGDCLNWYHRGHCHDQDGIQYPKIHWVICGGESGSHARPMHPDWVRDLRDQCAEAGTPFLFKQWGEWAPNWHNDENGKIIPGSEWMDRMGKRMSGNTLDGRDHFEWPMAQAVI